MSELKSELIKINPNFELNRANREQLNKICRELLSGSVNYKTMAAQKIATRNIIKDIKIMLVGKQLYKYYGIAKDIKPFLLKIGLSVDSIKKIYDLLKPKNNKAYSEWNPSYFSFINAKFKDIFLHLPGNPVIPNGFVIEPLGFGAEGIAINIGNNKVYKLIFKKDPKNKEAIITKKAGEIGIGPIIYDYGTFDNWRIDISPVPIIDDGNYIIMELIKGHTVADTGEGYGPGPYTTLNVIDAISKLLEIGIIHGDTHKDNILVDQHSRIRIIDYGLAKFTNPIITDDIDEDIFNSTFKNFFRDLKRPSAVAMACSWLRGHNLEDLYDPDDTVFDYQLWNIGKEDGSESLGFIFTNDDTIITEPSSEVIDIINDNPELYDIYKIELNLIKYNK